MVLPLSFLSTPGPLPDTGVSGGGGQVGAWQVPYLSYQGAGWEGWDGIWWVPHLPGQGAEVRAYLPGAAPSVNKITHTCENITFPCTTLVVGNQQESAGSDKIYFGLANNPFVIGEWNDWSHTTGENWNK